MKRRVLAFLIAFLSVFYVNAQEKKDKYLMETLVFNKVIEKKKVQLVDVRTPEEYAAGTIEYAENIDFLNEDFKTNISKLNKKEPVYVFCKSGKRSANAKKVMQEMGFKKVYELKGGYAAWNMK
ncbi:MAG: rhodanese-like domain-containing protein [Flavobacteriaceae bacterium]|jgi:rhodanese-related sulfurtransferase|nr:rhodanese-like domain-containing protein [Flavobacteriaceae bacterium]